MRAAALKDFEQVKMLYADRGFTLSEAHQEIRHKRREARGEKQADESSGRRRHGNRINTRSRPSSVHAWCASRNSALTTSGITMFTESGRMFPTRYQNSLHILKFGDHTAVHQPTPTPTPKGFSMRVLSLGRPVRTTALAFAFVFSLVGSAYADFTVDLPKGNACPSFDLRVQSIGEGTAKDFLDKEGNLVKSITAGRGAQLTFTNLATSVSLTLKSNGSVSKVTRNADGTSTWVITGHNVLILFPTDVPPGPTTTLYVGRVVFTVDNSTGVFTLLGTSGKSVDICAMLA
jgi:hypothetical protein